MVGEQQWWTWRIFPVFCVYGAPQETCCDLLSVRDSKAAQAASFQSVCKAALLRWSCWCAQSFLCQCKDFLWFLHMFSLLARALQCTARRQAVEKACRGHCVPQTPWARQQCGNTRATDEFWGFFSSGSGEFRKRKEGEKETWCKIEEAEVCSRSCLLTSSQFSLPSGAWAAWI